MTPTLAVCALALLAPASAHAFDLAKPGASAWERVKGGRLRLVTTPPAPDGSAKAALEIELDPGFKTYWWNPGRDGIPPQVSFFGSANVADAKLTLPPPHVFREASVSVGYKGAVRFPIDVQAVAPLAPYRLAASGIVGFCADVCVPVPFEFEVISPARLTAQEIAVSAGGALVEPSETLRLDEASFDPASGLMEVNATVPDTDVLLELVVANPDGALLPPAATSVHQKGDVATFTFDLSEAEATIADEDELTFTLVVAQLGQRGRIGVEQALPVSVID